MTVFHLFTRGRTLPEASGVRPGASTSLRRPPVDASRLLASTAGVLLLAVVAGPALATGPVSPAPVVATPPVDASLLKRLPAGREDLTLRGAIAPADATLLKRLPAGQEELTFRGENASKRWSMMLSRAELSRATRFRLALSNTVTVLPERSALTLMVNGQTLINVPVESTKTAKTVTVTIPRGLLRPGANDVRIDTVLTHRVDCSLKATYELWAMLDPAETGLVLEGGEASPVHRLDDLSALPLAADGTTRIHLRLQDGADAETIDRASRFIDALVRRQGLVRPLIDVGPQSGQGEGFDVILPRSGMADPTQHVLILGRDADVTLGRDPVTDRVVVAPGGEDAAAQDRIIGALFEALPPLAGQPIGQSDFVIGADADATFAQLGLDNPAFIGRRFLASIGLTLPADFYPANYDKIRLRIDGTHSASLSANAQLIFRVNGTIVSSLQLRAGEAEVFDHELVELPLRMFNPGHNELTIEGLTPSAADQQCNVMSSPAETRLTIAPTSELAFPHFARLGTLPQIPAALAARSFADPLPVYLSNATPRTIGIALTLLANRAASLDQAERSTLHLTLPTDGAAPGLVIAPYGQLTGAWASGLGTVLNPPSVAPAGGSAADVERPLAQTVAKSPEAYVKTFLSGVMERLRSNGFFFALTNPKDEGLTLGPNEVFVGAVAPRRDAVHLGGLTLPRFVQDPAQWLVVTADDYATLEKGVARLVSNGQWTRLAGAAGSLDLASNTLTTLRPVHVNYVMPSQIVLTDVRPIIGGIVSNNIAVSLAALLILLCSLGLSTYLLVRRMNVN